MNVELLVKRLSKARVALSRPAFRGALYNRVLPAVEHLAVLKRLGAVATVVDIGANVGQFAVVARQAFPTAQIIAFEPVPAAAARARSVFSRDERFMLIERALSDRIGESRFFVTSANDNSSLFEPTDRQRVETSSARVAAAMNVSTTTLDDAIGDLSSLARPTLLKLDTQGSELRILEGAGTTLRAAEHVIVEASFERLYDSQPLASDLIGFFHDTGWDLRAVYDVKTSSVDGSPLQADFLFGQGAPGG